MARYHTSQSVEECVRRLGPVEHLSLAESVGRILAHSFRAPADQPGFDQAARDGVAIRARDMREARETRPVIPEYLGTHPAGRAPAATVGPGQALGVSTGDPLPTGADAVLGQAYARPLGSRHVVCSRPAAKPASGAWQVILQESLFRYIQN